MKQTIQHHIVKIVLIKKLTPMLTYLQVEPDSDIKKGNKSKTMKPHLHRVNRIFDYTDKSEYDFILNQSERSQPIPHSYYTKFLRSLKQEGLCILSQYKKLQRKNM